MRLAFQLLFVAVVLATHPAIENLLWRHDPALSASILETGYDHRIRVALKHDPTRVTALQQFADQVSDPDSPQYGQYLSNTQLADFLSISPSSFATVKEWLASECGAHSFDTIVTRDVIFASLPKADLENCFNVRLKTFVPNHPALQFEGDARILVRSEELYSLPAHISAHVDLVQGISDFPPLSRRALKNYNLRQARKQSSAPGTAHFFRAVANNGVMDVRFVPVCSNGQFPTDPVALCNNAGGVLTNFVATFSTIINPTLHTATSTSFSCSTPSPNTVECSVPGVSVPMWDSYNVSITFALGNGQPQTSYFSYPVLNVPPVTPDVLYRLYDMPANPRSNGLGSLSLVEFEHQFYSPSDLTQFFQQWGLPSAPVTLVGPNFPNQPGEEASLDIQWASALAPGVPLTFWSIYANSTVEIDDILSWEFAMINATNPPLVSSLSYGMAEENVDTYLGPGYQQRSELEFLKFVALGLTVVFADGDTGAGLLGGPPLGASDCNVLHPDWPSNNPYVTAVGSTYVTPNFRPGCYGAGVDCSNGPLGEVGVALNFGTRWTTAGGFSWIEPQPSYQQAAVNNYLSNGQVLPPANVFNASGRAFPDVATVGHNLETVFMGRFTPIDGTSASAPIFAGMIALLNDARLAAGKSPLGFVNPLLYKLSASKPATFFDVVIGDNACGALGTQPECCPYGFKSALGWDAVTGLGTPQFGPLYESVMALP